MWIFLNTGNNASRYELMESGCFLNNLDDLVFFCRWFALAEMHLFIVIVIRMFDLKELDPIPLPVSS